MKKNDVLVGTVTDFGFEGEGIIKTENNIVFLPFAIPGEKVRYRVLKVAKNLVYGKVEEILTPAELRVRAKCPVFTKCGGCSLMHINYKKQLDIKREQIKSCFKKIALVEITPSPTVASRPEFYYRNKLQLPIRMGQEYVEVGFFAQNSHRIVPINNCVIHGAWCEGVIKALKKYAAFANLSAYDEASGKGLLRHIVVKRAGNEFIVILVINGNKIPQINYFVQLLEECLKQPFSLFINVNKRQDNVILGEQFTKVCGTGFIRDEFKGITYTCGPQSFIQVNEYVKGRLYCKAVELATAPLGENQGLNVIDAYCGAGLLTALLANKSERVTGIEIVPEAIESAKKLAIENEIKNVNFICAPCEEVLPEVIGSAGRENSVLVLDPPRKGLDRKIVEAILKSRPRRIVYISCSPQSLARDVGLIGGTLKYDDKNVVKAENGAVYENCIPKLPNGYTVKYLRGFDMFAQCKGVETICELQLEE